jgi:SAM-dependent MidA family methyltransferase
MDADLRRQPPADLSDVESDPVLVERLSTEIRSGGPMTFARFMEVALYDPERGYYRSIAARPGRGGDFLTAPEADPIFGRAIARLLEDVWHLLDEPLRFTVREHGSGSGALAIAALEGLAGEGSGLARAIRWRAVEIEPSRTAELAERLATGGFSSILEADDGTPIEGVILANEVLDALPTHRVVMRKGDLREVYVGLAETPDARDEAVFVDVEDLPSTPKLADRLAAEGVALADGQRAEVCLAIDDWVSAAGAGLGRGVLLLIDYGHPAAELYEPRRRMSGTLATYLRHTVGEDPYRAIGRQDLTAHVDVTAVERAAASADLDHLGTTTQASFLDALGAGELLVALQTAPGATLEAYLGARSALVRMIDPAAMGGFRVMAFGRGLPAGAALRGLAVIGDRPHRTPPDRTLPD